MGLTSKETHSEEIEGFKRLNPKLCVEPAYVVVPRNGKRRGESKRVRRIQSSAGFDARPIPALFPTLRHARHRLCRPLALHARTRLPLSLPFVAPITQVIVAFSRNTEDCSLLAGYRYFKFSILQHTTKSIFSYLLNRYDSANIIRRANN